MHKTRTFGPVSTLTGISIALILLGALLVWQHSMALTTIVFVIGSLISAFGAIAIFDYFKGKSHETWMIYVGAVEIIIGIIMAVFAGELVNVAFVLLGVVMLIIGLMQLVDNYRYRTGGLQLVFGILRITIGALLIAAPFVTGTTNIDDMFIEIVGVAAIVVGVFLLMLED